MNKNSVTQQSAPFGARSPNPPANGIRGRCPSWQGISRCGGGRPATGQSAKGGAARSTERFFRRVGDRRPCAASSAEVSGANMQGAGQSGIDRWTMAPFGHDGYEYRCRRLTSMGTSHRKPRGWPHEMWAPPGRPRQIATSRASVESGQFRRPASPLRESPRLSGGQNSSVELHTNQRQQDVRFRHPGRSSARSRNRISPKASSA